MWMKKKKKGGRYSAPRQKKQPQPSARRRWGVREWCMLLIPAVAAVTAVFLVLLLVDIGSTYQLEEEGTVYYAGDSHPVLRGTQMKYQPDGTMTLTEDGKTTSTKVPVYLNNSREMVMTQDLLFYGPRTMKGGRVVHFNHVICQEDGSVYFSDEVKKIQTEAGFLYDGDDMYIFLEPVSLEFGGYKQDLPALSYVQADYGGSLVIFNYDTKESIIQDSGNVVNASCPQGGYRVSLLSDSMEFDDGSKILLLSDPQLRNPVL